MKDLQNLMRQAQGMQQKLAEAQARLAESLYEGRAGGGLVTLSLRGDGELVALEIKQDLLTDADAETLADLILAAHKEAKANLDATSREVMQKTMGPLAGMAGLAGPTF